MPTVTREIVIDAPAEAVWHHVADPDRRRRWMGGDLDVELAPGRRGTFDDGRASRAVRVDAVESGRSVTFTWGDDDGSTVTIEVSPDRDGSRVRVTESAGVDERSAPDEPDVSSETGGHDGDVVASVMPWRRRPLPSHRRPPALDEQLAA